MLVQNMKFFDQWQDGLHKHDIYGAMYIHNFTVYDDKHAGWRIFEPSTFR